MKVAIVGSRDFPEHKMHLVSDYVKGLPKDTVIVSGGARGVDTVAEVAAKESGLPEPKIFKPEYDKYPKRVAPIMRNTQIVEYADRVVAFWDGVSRGTLDSINKAKKLNKEVIIINGGD